MSKSATLLLDRGDTLKAIEVLDKMVEVMPTKNFPLNNSIIGATLTERTVLEAINTYLRAGEIEKDDKWCDEFLDVTMLALIIFGKENNGEMLSIDEVQRNLYYILMVSETYEKNGLLDKAKKYSSIIDTYIKG